MTQRDNLKRIAILAGDGIGPEVMEQSRRILDWFMAHGLHEVAVEELPYGATAYRTFGAVLPEASWQAARNADAILFGATGGPEYDAIPAAARRGGNLLRIRRDLDLYANLRPIIAIDSLNEASSLKNRVLKGVDLVIVRELTAGLYFGEPRGIERLPDGSRRCVNTHSYTSAQIERVARDAFELARGRRGQVCSVEKSNVMESGAMWREEVEALRGREFRDITLTHMLADNCAMQLVRAPAQFDVIVTDNMFGDILSDGAAMAAGSLGMLPSASLGPIRADGSRQVLYEPVHGSAPDIAGRGIANPLGAILSLGMALRLTMERPDAAAALDRAVRAALAKGVRTRDILHDGMTLVGTHAMGDAILQELERG
ncbi:MAG TPA: 3-isopropylmalate dehydrogenase [Stellaceae bacterium]|nr:3-isopropylmalate dehydrogenase [Stellaceae bacterium]